LKDFFKQISIYGILPVVGKFAGFFLIPIYARLFSSAEFGMLELLMTMIKFLLFACNLEFYSAIGRFFYERKSLIDKKKLISTGLILTIITSSIVSFTSIVFEENISEAYLNSSLYWFEFKLCIIWLFLEASSVYLSVIPRYDKKPKLFVGISISSLLIRVSFTIIYVLILDLGIAGVIYGHITGAIVSLIGYGVASKKYLAIQFSKSDAKEIVKFAFPIVPGLLLIGLWGPISRNLISEYFSLATLGLFAFAIRIAAVMEILNGAIRMAWSPMLFENFKNPSFVKDTERISKMVGMLAVSGAIGVILLAPEIAKYVGTKEFEESAILIGFLTFAGIIEVLNRLRGFGPLILKKTYILTVVEIVRIVLSVFILIQFRGLGLIGIGVAFLVPAFLKYLILTAYTSKAMKINFIYRSELLLFSVALMSLIMVQYELNFISRITMSILTLLYFIYIFKNLKKDTLSD